MRRNDTDLLQIISEPRRREILRLVWDDELSATTIADSMPDVTFGAVSQHLRVLRDAGIVNVRVDGRFRWYRADQDRLGPLAEYLTAMWSDRLQRLKTLAEETERQHARKKRH